MLNYSHEQRETKNWLALAQFGENNYRSVFPDVHIEYSKGIFDSILISEWGIQRIYDHKLQLGGFADADNRRYVYNKIHITSSNKSVLRFF